MVGRATANGCMIEHLAFRVISAYSRTRVYALLVFASFVERTIGADNTFRMTCRRSADVTDATGTNSVAVRSLAFAVWSTRRWMAGINRREVFN